MTDFEFLVGATDISHFCFRIHHLPLKEPRSSSWNPPGPPLLIYLHQVWLDPGTGLGPPDFGLSYSIQSFPKPHWLVWRGPCALDWPVRITVYLPAFVWVIGVPAGFETEGCETRAAAVYIIWEWSHSRRKAELSQAQRQRNWIWHLALCLWFKLDPPLYFSIT